MPGREHDWIAFGLVVLLVLVVIIGALVLMGPQVGACFCGVTNNLRVAMPTCSC